MRYLNYVREIELRVLRAHAMPSNERATAGGTILLDGSSYLLGGLHAVCNFEQILEVWKQIRIPTYDVTMH